MPVLVKLLDCNQWLSLQVHPNDRQAQEMEGAGQFGKTEAWYFLATDADAEILCGVKSGMEPETVEKAVRDGTILDRTNRVKVSVGDHVLIPAGTIHALGPGMLVYEVQESSDITYRVFDWNRPASQGRVLHIEQSVRVIDAGLQVEVHNPVDQAGVTKLLGCEYFQLEKITLKTESITETMDGTTFHILTVISGSADLSGDGWEFTLHQFDSLVLPACTSRYSINCQSGCAVLRVTA
jgi:mannose-6-phosphate isomerase